MANSSTTAMRGGRVAAGMTRDVVYYTVHAASLAAAAAAAAALNGNSSTSSTFNSPDSLRREPITPPLDAADFDYVLRLDNLSSVRRAARR